MKTSSETPFNRQYWEKRYTDKDTSWDIGYPSTPLKEYFDQLTDKSLKILIPGAGNGYEAEYLWKNGFVNTYVIDLSPIPLKHLHDRVPDMPESQLIEGDFFLHQEKYDLIIEQTFFCALDPSLRKGYVEKMHSLLKPGGKLVGLLFNDPLYHDHPPFGGSKEEYEKLFEPAFSFKVFEEAKNSIQPREGRELFMIATPTNS